MQNRNLITVKESGPSCQKESFDWSSVRGGLHKKWGRGTFPKGWPLLGYLQSQTVKFILREWKFKFLMAMSDKEITSIVVKYLPEGRVTIVDFFFGSKSL